MKALILLNLAFFGAHPQIFFTVKRKVTVCFDGFFCEIASYVYFSFFPFSFFLLAMLLVINTELKRKRKSNLHLLPRIWWWVSQRAAGLDLYIRCKDFMLECWLSIPKYNCSSVIPSLLRTRRRGYSCFLTVLHFLNLEHLIRMTHILR